MSEAAKPYSIAVVPLQFRKIIINFLKSNPLGVSMMI